MDLPRSNFLSPEVKKVTFFEKTAIFNQKPPFSIEKGHFSTSKSSIFRGGKKSPKTMYDTWFFVLFFDPKTAIFRPPERPFRVSKMAISGSPKGHFSIRDFPFENVIKNSVSNMVFRAFFACIEKLKKMPLLEVFGTKICRKTHVPNIDFGDFPLFPIGFGQNRDFRCYFYKMTWESRFSQVFPFFRPADVRYLP